ncbi:MAG: hypothetical protein Q9164_006062 [Protoblastenia rupestris]
MRALSGVKKTLSNMASSTALLAPLKEIKVSSHQIPAFENMPNTSIQNKPLLIYHGAFRSNTSATIIERHLSDIGVVEAEWRYSMYTFSHFHSTSHEVLCVYSGSAKLCFGGEDNPQRVEVVVGKGDVMIVPAGVAHRLLEDHDGGFSMVGCYPKGKRWDMCYGRDGEEGNEKRIAILEWFERDPIYGREGPVLQA